MNLSQAYSTVIRFGRGNPEDIKAFSEKANELPTDTEPDISHPDHFLADYLEDHDDPRHLIVRKDLEIRNEKPDTDNEGFSPKLNFHVRKRIGNFITRGTLYISSDTPADLSANKVVGTKANLYQVSWAPEGRGHFLEGVFTPEEFEQFLKDYGSTRQVSDWN